MKYATASTRIHQDIKREAYFALKSNYASTSMTIHQYVKEAAYKGLAGPVLEYGRSVWDPKGVVLQKELESVQRRAPEFVTGNYNFC